MTKDTHAHASMGRGVTQHDVELMRRKSKQQPFRIVLATHQPDMLRQAKRRLQNPVGDEFGHHVRDADYQAHGPPARPSFEHIDQFAAEREDFVGIPVNHLASLRERQAPAGLGKQLLAQIFLERTNLAADRGLREAQLLAGPGDAALLGHRPEVKQVVVIQPIHGSTIHRDNRCFYPKLSIYRCT